MLLLLYDSGHQTGCPGSVPRSPSLYSQLVTCWNWPWLGIVHVTRCHSRIVWPTLGLPRHRPTVITVIRCLQNVEVLASRSSASEQSQAGAEQRVRALQEENKKLQADVGALERSAGRLRAQVADAEGREAKSQEKLKEQEVRPRRLIHLVHLSLEAVSRVG